MVNMSIQKLAIRKFSRDAVPPGGNIMDGIKALQDPKLSKKLKECIEWAEEAVNAVRKAKEPNPYKDMTDDEIAQVILDKVKRDEEQ